MKRILSSELLVWLRDKKVESILLSLNDENCNDHNCITLRGFYIEKDNEIKSVIEKEVTVQDDIKLEVKEPLVLTNKEKGQLFLEWIKEYVKKENEVAFIFEDKLHVKSPAAFIFYESISGHKWGTVQKGGL